MLNVLKLGHAEFEVRDVERMAEFYSNVIGLSETGRDGQTVYLSTSINHHSIVLRGGASKTRLSKLAFQVSPVANGDLIKHFKDNGLNAEVRTGGQPAINQVVRTQNPDGVAIELYSEFQPSAHPYSMKGVNPLKLSHVASLTPDVKAVQRWQSAWTESDLPQCLTEVR